jgi:hypothetical protein
MEFQQAEIENTDYLTINHSAILVNRKYFYDAIHVNSLGRQLSSLAFAKDLVAIKNK